MNKYAVISTDNNPDYYNLIPLCCYSWKKLGFEPIVVFVNVEEDIKQRIKDACTANFSRYCCISENSVISVKDSTIAQLSRLFLAEKHNNIFNEEDILITGDVDMIQPKDIFSKHLWDGFTNWGHDITGFSDYPICYNAAPAKVWRELMGEYHIPEAAYSKEWVFYWDADQKLLTRKIKEYGERRIKVVSRNAGSPPRDRWDRSNWSVIPKDIIDVHMKRNDPQAQLDVFHKLWPNDDDSWLIKFLNV